jgi:uncharacterized protein (DUF433 family)
MRAEMLKRIVVDPNICFGKPTIRGTRIWVALIVEFLAEGWSHQQILAEYPSLEEDEIRAALAYAAEVSRERVLLVRGKGSVSSPGVLD